MVAVWKIAFEQNGSRLGFLLEDFCLDPFEQDEVWKIVDIESAYCQISNKGNIRQIIVSQSNGDVTIQVKVPKLSSGTDGCVVELYDIHEKLAVYSELGKLVLETFQRKPNLGSGEFYIASHKDGNKRNNDISNLEWCTHKNRCSCGTWLEQDKKSFEVPVLQYNKKNQLIREWDSILVAAKELRCGKHNIRQCCDNMIASSYGFKWKYKFEESDVGDKCRTIT